MTVTCFLKMIIDTEINHYKQRVNLKNRFIMKNIVYTLYIFLFCMLQAVAQTTTQNHVKTTTYRQPTTTTDISKAKINVTYYDGLGRPTQQVAGKASATGKDIITHIEYDGIGRQSREYLPYGASTSTLAFDASAQTNTVTFYNNAAYENTDNPYSEKIFEASPLNRIRKQAAPGEAWKANEQWINGKFLDQDHTIKYAYQTNILDEVSKLNATATWNATNKVYDISFVSNGNYAVGQLYKSMTVSEERTSFYVGTALVSKSYLTEEFKDKEGRLVLKRKYLTTNSADTFFTFPLDTYYVYDQYGNLTYVLPPLAKGTISQLDDLCYQYKYDSKNRLVEKKLPGKNWEFIVYDGLDRIVATGPTASPFGDGATGWLYNMYDSFGRVSLTGWYPASVTATTRKTLQDANTSVVNILRGTSTIDGINTGYTAASLVPSGFKLLSAKYYDNYTFPGGLTTLPTTIEAQAVLPDAKGLATGSWTRAITTSAQTFGETAYTLYDKKMRPIRSMTTNYLGGYTQTDIKLDFDGKTLYTITKHKRLGTGTETELTVRDDFAYTVQDRLLRQTHKINNLPTQLITYNTYDELGQLLVKKVGGVDVTGTTSLQKIDYTYNIRGWLKGINNITDLALPSAPQDLFAFKINYNDTPSNGVNGSVQPKYNGNIAETSWRTASDNIQRRYGYEYDNMERLNNAWYLIPGASVELRKSYDEYVKYDWNGNITSLQRNGESDNDVTTIAIDNLAYTYSGNRLTKVVDSTNHPKGFKDSSDNTGDDYTYYDNGNMKTDKNKGIITPIKYNHLNLPTEIVFNNNSATKIVYIYDAEGKKLKKTVTNGATVITDYLSGYQYQNGVLEFFPTSEGYVKSTVSGSVTTYNYVFNYKDHLGNVRVSYTVDPADNVLKIMDENHYYPFGLKHNGYSPTQKIFGIPLPVPPYVVLTPVLNDGDDTYKIKYQGQELQDELGLGWYSFKWRNYDPAIGRFFNIDPLTEKYVDWGPYVFSGNRIIDARELEGLEPYIVTGRAFIPDKTLANPNPFSKTSSFAGDNRQSYKVNTTAYRTEQKVRVDFDNNKVSTLNNRANSTTGYDENGQVRETSSPAKAGPTPTYTPGTMKDGSTTINMQVDASNKLVSGAPAINYDVDVTVTDQGDGNFNYNISGKSDGFPAYEFFITNEATNKSYLIHGSNPAANGKSPTSLFPPMENTIEGSGNSKDLTPVEEVKF